MTKRKFGIWKCVSVFLAANFISVISAGFTGDKAFYDSFRQPAIAPPGWLFAPMWLFLNIMSLIALYRIANLAPSRNRRIFLMSETLGWVLFAIFATLYFGLRSPILAAVDTVACLGAAMISVIAAWTLDRTASLLVGLRLLWLLLASYVSTQIALTNVDQFFS